MNVTDPESVKLPATEIRRRCADLNGWRYRDNRLEREFVFRDFSAAFGFMTQVALRAEQQDHHPEWSNVYNRVRIALTTHEAGGVSGRDFRLAASIDDIADGQPAVTVPLSD
jgi:4a-hydroxytetrahydrobiopterin dehydratase